MDNDNWVIWSIIIVILCTVYLGIKSGVSSGCEDDDFECQYMQDRAEALNNPASAGRR
jgi:hypothetical protein